MTLIFIPPLDVFNDTQIFNDINFHSTSRF
jgi:hypothetical protein